MEIKEIPEEKIKEIKKYIRPFHIDKKRQEKVYGEIKERILQLLLLEECS